MKRRLTFGTHAFAKRVSADTTGWSCSALIDVIYANNPGMYILRAHHIAAWLRKQYLDGEVRSFDAHCGGYMLVLKFEIDDGVPCSARRKAMAERLLAKPDRRASVTVDL